MQYGDYFTAKVFMTLSSEEKRALYNAFKFIGLPMSYGASEYLSNYDLYVIENFVNSNGIFVYNERQNVLWLAESTDLAYGKYYTKQDLLNLIELTCVGN